MTFAQNNICIILIPTSTHGRPSWRADFMSKQSATLVANAIDTEAVCRRSHHRRSYDRESLRLAGAQISPTSMPYTDSFRKLLGPRPSGLRASSKPFTCFCFSFMSFSSNLRIRTLSHTESSSFRVFFSGRKKVIWYGELGRALVIQTTPAGLEICVVF